MRILVTNDDGVHAPGLAALTRALAAWAAKDTDHVVTVVAPLANHSGASAAVGTVYERESIPYKAFSIDGADNVAVYGLDASPALSVIIGGLGAFGPRPDLVVSGINLGVNVGRSVLHSGTVGAVLTAAQLGLRGIAVSMRSGAEIDHWETAADLAVALIPLVATSPPRTVVNLNVPSLPSGELRGIRRGRISTAGIIKAAADAIHRDAADGAGTGSEGEIRLTLGTAVPSLGDVDDPDSDEDTALVGAGYAAITPIVGVHAADGPDADALAEAAVGLLSSHLPA